MADERGLGDDSVVGATEAEAEALSVALRVDTFADLANSPHFVFAMELVNATSNPDHPLRRFGIPRDRLAKAFEDKAIEKLVDAPLIALASISKQNEQQLVKALSVKTIRELATWPPFLRARELLAEAVRAGTASTQPRIFRVSGLVVRADSTPVVGAHIRIRRQGIRKTMPLASPATVISNDNGGYIFEYARPASPIDLNVHLLADSAISIADQVRVIVQAGVDERVDFVVGVAVLRGPSTFERLETVLSQTLASENITPSDVVDFDEEALARLAIKTGIDPRTLVLLRQSYALGRQLELPAGVFFGMGREKLPLSLSALLVQDSDKRRAAVKSALAGNHIPAKLENEAARVLTKLDERTVVDALKQPSTPGVTTLGALLVNAKLSATKQKKLADAYVTHAGTNKEFWKEIGSTGVLTADEINRVQFTLQLGVVTQNHAPLVKAVMARGISDVGALATLSKADWLDLIESNGGQPSGLPADVSAAGLLTGDYADAIVRVVEDALVTKMVAHRIDNFPDSGLLKTFFTRNPTYDLRTAVVRNFLDANPNALDFATSDAERANVEKRLKGLERSYRVAPPGTRVETMELLLKEGLDSAQKIRVLGRAAFVRRFSAPLGRERAERVWTRANNATALATTLLARHSTLFDRTPMHVLPARSPITKLASAEQLFGSFDFCSCEHCTSVFSPAAYLVDVLHWLRNRPAAIANKTALDVLFDNRRADLGTIELSCTNTNTPLPYIDLVNEVLELTVAPVVPTPAYQTTGNAANLRAHPEHLHRAAYEVLAGARGSNPAGPDAIYPFNLPFNLWIEEARTYLGQLAVTRYRLMEVLQGEKQARDQVDVAAETLGMSPLEWDICAGEALGATRTVAAFWGLPDDPAFTDKLKQVSLLLEHATPPIAEDDMEFDELADLLRTDFVQDAATVGVQFNGPNCDTTKMQLVGLVEASLERMHRFVRLRRRLGWSAPDLDRAIQTLGGGALDEECLVKIAHVRRLATSLHVRVEELLTWWGTLDTRRWSTRLEQTDGVGLVFDRELTEQPESDDEASPYDRIFQTTSITTEPVNVFGVNSTGTALASTDTQDLKDHVPAIAGALGVTAEDLAELPLVSTGKLNLANLSALYRHVSLARAVNLKMRELVAVVQLTGVDPFATARPREALDFLDELRAIHKSSVSIAELDYLLRHKDTKPATLEPNDADISVLLFELGEGLRKAEADHQEPVDPLTADELNRIAKTAVVIEKLSAAVGLDHALAAPLLRDHLRHPDASGRPLLEVFADGSVVNFKRTQPGSDEPVLPDRTDLPDQFESFKRLHKAALILNRLRIQKEELSWVLEQGPAQGILDMQELPVAASAVPVPYVSWSRLRDALSLRDQLSPRELFDLFEAAAAAEASGSAGDIATAHETLLSELERRSRWDRADIEFLVGIPARGGNAAVPGVLGFAYPQDWKDERPLTRLSEVVAIVRRVGLPAATLWPWRLVPVPAGDSEAEQIDAINKQATQAEEIKQAVRARHQDAEWYNVAPALRDRLRERQRDSLVGWLVGNRPRFADANAIFEHLLLDVEMSPCQLTSRIRQAMSSAQLFVQRTLLGLEVDPQSGPLIVLDTDDANEWEWMKNYRVWEANRRVFLYPENWIEPELRDDKTPFFRELEEELLQGEITAASTERALRGYLEKLDQVARLDVAAQFHQKDDGADILHVFGRTRGTPHIYYYRQRRDGLRWTPWEKVDVDIESDHLIAVVFNRRLYVFWPLISDAAVDEEPTQIPDAPKLPKPERPKRYYQIRLAWSERRGDRWNARRIARTFIGQEVLDAGDITNAIRKTIASRPSDFFFRAYEERGDLMVEPIRRVHSTGAFLKKKKDEHEPGIDIDIPIDTGLAPDTPTADDLSGYVFLPRFRLSGCDGTITLEDLGGKAATVHTPPGTETKNQSFTRRSTVLGLSLPARSPVTSALEMQPTLGIATPPFEILPLRLDDFESRDAFFYQDRRRTFFVRPRLPFPWLRPSPNWVIAENVTLDILAMLQDFSPRPESPAPDPWVFDPTAVATRPDAIAVIAPAAVARPASSGQGLTSLTHEAVEEAFGARLSFVGTQPAESVSRSLVLAVNARVVDATGRTLAQARTGMPSAEVRPPGSVVVSRTFTMPASNAEGVLFGPSLKSNGGTRYRFESFYHPYVCMVMRELNRFGLRGVFDPEPLGSEPELLRQEKREDFFANEYAPLAVSNPLPVDEFDFSYGGAYSIYNWELFFHVPLSIACQLSKNQQFAEAQRWFHFIFDPTETNGAVPQRFWKAKPLFELFLDENATAGSINELLLLLQYDGSDPDLLKQRDEVMAQVADWRANPFRPHALARLRLSAYARTVVMKYVDNLIAWGDQLFRRDTMESINEATQLYTLASQILGSRPRQVNLDSPTPRTFNELGNLDAFSNAVVEELEGFLPEINESEADLYEDDVALVGPSLFFCVPANDKLLTEYWNRVADRLFKIRHCMNIEGVVRQLALFEPPIDPALLVRAKTLGVDLASALSNLDAPQPLYRYQVLSQKATELCADVRGLGQALLSTLEKKDAEELALLRAGHEVKLQNAILDIRKKQIREAEQSLESLQRSKENAEIRRDFYRSRAFTNAQEAAQLKLSATAGVLDAYAQVIHLTGQALSLTPQLESGGAGFGGSPVVTASFGGIQISYSIESAADATKMLAGIADRSAQLAGLIGSFQRRSDDWELQREMAEKEIESLEAQTVAAEIRVAIAEKELQNLELQLEQSQASEEFLRTKYTNDQLYQWMVGQLSSIYFQSYQLAYEMARRAERAWQFELAVPDQSFIQFGYWDSLKKGLLAGDRLHHDLKRMEVAYLDQNRREYELTKHVAVSLLDPVAFAILRQTGSCVISIPEALFDLDCPGHFLRRLKSVAVTIPCVTGPYTGVSCTLTLLKNSVRHANTLNGGGYARTQNDNRFTDNAGAIESIVTSGAQSDSGLFENNLRDDRYLPFEGAGAISEWRIELPQDFRSFNYDSISDIILHLRYTSRDGGDLLKQQAALELRDAVNAIVRSENESGLARMFSLRHEFPTEWHRFLNPGTSTGNNTLTVGLSKQRFPFLVRDKAINIENIRILAKLNPGAAGTHTESSLHLALAAGSSAPTSDSHQPSDLTKLKLSSETGLLKGEAGFTEPPGNWTMNMWLNQGDRIRPDAFTDIILICTYKVS